MMMRLFLYLWEQSRVRALGTPMPGPRLPERMRKIFDARPFGPISYLHSIGIAAACAAVCAVLLAVTLSRAQSSSSNWEKTAGGKMSFEVASVKQNTSGLPPNGDNPRANFSLDSTDAYSQNGGLLTVVNFPLFSYIGFAYKLTPFERTNLQSQLPKWAQTDRFDIQARGAAGTTKDQMRLMMQSLLADRFKLAVHTETQDGPVFGVVLMNAGKTGPQLQPHLDDPPCGDSAAPAPGVTPTGYPMRCGAILIMLGGMPPNNHPSMLGRDITIQQIADMVQIIPAAGGFDRPLVDETGLNGKFDVKLSWTPLSGPGASPDSTAPIFLDNMKDQLGLKLESRTAPIGKFVLDHIEEPTAN